MPDTTTDRIPVLKTWKLLINGAFPRSESGRTLPLKGHDRKLVAHLSHASRKDLREAVEAARTGFGAWSGSTAYLRSQIVYRLAEMLEGRRADLAEGIRATTGATSRAALAEVDASIDRTVSWAGWCDKFQQVLGSRNPVAGPYHNFSMPEPSGVCVAMHASGGEQTLLGFLSLVLPPLCAGNAVVAIADPKHPLGALLVAESVPTADLPAGALNVLTGDAAELASWVAAHRDVESIHACVPKDLAATLRAGAAENLKRVVTLPADEDFADAARWTSPARLAAFVETKTIWHPSGR
jgi:acyl-CoA reductase-like NAD-dependent aldehyde dehydrogenase